ncbi:hypothetical protein BC829DRAFT_382111 [Chytridium lagenaria]|nr:hypothetical protein BC829DRAFT_382111 [Chytridium lagenaria]
MLFKVCIPLLLVIKMASTLLFTNNNLACLSKLSYISPSTFFQTGLQYQSLLSFDFGPFFLFLPSNFLLSGSPDCGEWW